MSVLSPYGLFTNRERRVDAYYEPSECIIVEIYVKDSGSDMVWGPFAPGFRMKYTEPNGAKPNSKKTGSDIGQAGNIDLHLTGNGDAEVYAVYTFEGKKYETTHVFCLVPPPPM